MRGKILHDRANNSRQILKLTTIIVETKNTLRFLKLLKVSSSKVALKHLILFAPDAGKKKCRVTMKTTKAKSLGHTPIF
jgi:hypothetical protein